MLEWFWRWHVGLWRQTDLTTWEKRILWAQTKEPVLQAKITLKFWRLKYHVAMYGLASIFITHFFFIKFLNVNLGEECFFSTSSYIPRNVEEWKQSLWNYAAEQISWGSPCQHARVSVLAEEGARVERRPWSQWQGLGAAAQKAGGRQSTRVSCQKPRTPNQVGWSGGWGAYLATEENDELKH